MNMHKIIAYEAAFLQGVPTEIGIYYGNIENCPSGLKNNICDGLYDEDADRDPRINPGNPFVWFSLFNWGTHFWNPEGGPHGGLLESVGNVALNLDSQNAYQRAKDLYEKAVSIYNDDPFYAYYLLGRVVHLLEDMATPSHVHLDPHIDDSTIYGDDSFEEYLNLNYSDDEDGIVRFRKDFSFFNLLPINYKILPDGGYSEEPPLFNIFYSMANISKSFDSDDADGSIDRGIRRGKSIIPVRNISTLKYAWAIKSNSFEKKILLNYGISKKRNKFILSNFSIKSISEVSNPFDSIKLDFVDGSEIYSLRDFVMTDIDDKNITDTSRILIPSAIKHTAMIYKLFWNDTHPTFIKSIPLLELNEGKQFMPITKGPIDIKIYVDPKDWLQNNVEVFAWVDAFFGGDRVTLYFFNNTWHPFYKHYEMRPAISDFRLHDIDLIWRLLYDSSLLSGLVFNLNLCIDRFIDGFYTPAESICDGVSIKIS